MSSWVVAVATIVLVLVTAWYVRLTKQLVEAQKREGLLSDSPVLGIRIKSISLGKLWYPERNRRTLRVAIDLENIGVGPALEVGIDSYLELDYVERGGGYTIPARSDESMLPFLKPGEVATERDSEQHFGGDGIDALLENMREESRLNMERIARGGYEPAYHGTRLSVVATYRTIRGQWYSVRLTVPIDLTADYVVLSKERPEPRFPAPDDTDELVVLGHTAAQLVAKPVLHEDVESERAERDARRWYSGW